MQANMTLIREINDLRGEMTNLKLNYQEHKATKAAAEARGKRTRREKPTDGELISCPPLCDYCGV